MNWSYWHKHFEANSKKIVPTELKNKEPFRGSKEIIRSLSIFQLGEAGEGRIAQQIDKTNIYGIDDDYRKALKLFVKEEGRHARLLALCLRGLGGKVLEKNWTERIFVFARRLIGIRLKLMVLLSAEVIGICFYDLLAPHLPEEIRNILLDICEEEKLHLDFHCDFFKSQIQRNWHRFLFKALWLGIGSAAAFTVIIDHRKTLRDLNIPISSVWNKFKYCIRLTDNSVLKINPYQFSQMKGVL